MTMRYVSAYGLARGRALSALNAEPGHALAPFPTDIHSCGLGATMLSFSLKTQRVKLLGV